MLAVGAPLVAPTTLHPLPRAAAAEPGEPLPARITLTAVAPSLVTRDATVQVKGSITNTGTAPLDEVVVRLRAVGGRLGTRLDVAAWLDGKDQREGVPVEPSVTLPHPLAPGGRARFVLDVPAGALALGPEFGVYPLVVDARATPEGGERDQVALTRTTLQWQPESRQYEAQQITWLVPFTGLPGPVAGTGDAAQQLARTAAAVGPGSRLRDLLDAASGPGVVWAVDPELLSTLQQAATAPGTSSPTSTGTATSGGTATTPTGTGSPTTGGDGDGTDAGAADRAVVRDYLADLKAAAVGREVVELPYADPDLEALGDAGALAVLPAARAAGAGTITEVLGVTPRTDVVWPADGYASDELVTALAGQGTSALVLDDRTRPLVEALSYTPDARTTSLPQDTTAVLSDSALSGLLARTRRTNAASTSRLLAETAAATTERPGLSRRLLVTVSRTAELDPTAFRSAVAAASAAPWLRTTPLDALLAPAADRGDSSTLARREGPAPRGRRVQGIRGADVQVGLGLRSQLSALGEVVDDPVGTTAGLQRSTLDLFSSTWRGHRTELPARQQRERQDVARLTRQVRVLPTTITFLRSSGQLVLTISNDLDQPVHDLRLKVVAPSPRLVVSQEVSDPLTLQPGTRASVRVPVRALASGEVALQAQLLAPSGAVLGATEQVKVRVRPTDSWVLTVGGVVVGLVLAVGLVRALRRPRRRARAATTPRETLTSPDLEDGA
ncbi:DUF6049 family protein [Angustibacter peucedani]